MTKLGNVCPVAPGTMIRHTFHEPLATNAKFFAMGYPVAICVKCGALYAVQLEEKTDDPGPKAA